MLPRSIYLWLVLDLFLIHHLKIIVIEHDRDSKSHHQFCKSLAQTNPLPTQKRRKSMRVALPPIRPLEIRRITVEPFWQEFLRLDPLPRVMVHIINCDDDVFAGGYGFAVDDYVLVEGRGEGLGDDGLVAESFEEAEAEVVEFVGHLLV